MKSTGHKLLFSMDKENFKILSFNPIEKITHTKNKKLDSNK